MSERFEGACPTCGQGYLEQRVAELTAQCTQLSGFRYKLFDELNDEKRKLSAAERERSEAIMAELDHANKWHAAFREAERERDEARSLCAMYKHQRDKARATIERVRGVLDGIDNTDTASAIDWRLREALEPIPVQAPEPPKGSYLGAFTDGWMRPMQVGGERTVAPCNRAQAPEPDAPPKGERANPLYEMAKAAAERNAARAGEDIGDWANKLAADSVKAGEAERGEAEGPGPRQWLALPEWDRFKRACWDYREAEFGSGQQLTESFEALDKALEALLDKPPAPAVSQGQNEITDICPQCGPGQRSDEDGCCAACGATLVFQEVLDQIRAALAKEQKP